MGRFLQDFGAHPHDWVGRDRKEVGLEIGEALRKIAKRKKHDGGWQGMDSLYSAPNGWGTVKGATRFLIHIWFACFDEIPDTVDVSY